MYIARARGEAIAIVAPNGANAHYRVQVIDLMGDNLMGRG